MVEKAESLNTQAINFAANGEFKEAIACFKRALVVEKSNHLLWYNLGVTYRDAGQLESAKECLLKALDINNIDKDTLDSLSIICLSLKEFDEAFDYCSIGLDLYPTDAHLWNTCGVILFNQVNYPEAAEAFERAVTINPYYYDALYNLRDTYDELGNQIGKAECISRMNQIKKSGE